MDNLFGDNSAVCLYLLKVINSNKQVNRPEFIQFFQLHQNGEAWNNLAAVQIKRGDKCVNDVTAVHNCFCLLNLAHTQADVS